MNVLSLIKKNLANCISDGKVFIYDSETLSAVAFLNGLKHEKLDDVKKIIKDNGFRYDNHYECYIFDKNNQIQNRRGYVYQTNSKGQYAPTPPRGNNQLTLTSAPWYFYFGLKKGASAMDKFTQLYIQSTEE